MRLYNVTKWLLVACLPLLYVLAGCSGDDDESGVGGGGFASPYWPLQSGNSNMPSSGTLVAQYSDSPANAGIGNLADGNADTRFQTPHTSFDIT